MTNPTTYIDSEAYGTDTDIGLMDSVRADYRALIARYDLHPNDDATAWRSGRAMHARGEPCPSPLGFGGAFNAKRFQRRTSRYRGWKHADSCKELDALQ